MPMLVPLAAAGGVVLALLLSRKKGGGPNEKPLVEPPPDTKPDRGFVRPKIFPNAPTDAQATVAPACGPNDPAKCRNGLLIHTAPNRSVETLIGPEDASPTSKHLVTGDQAVLLKVNVPDASNPPTTRLWAEVISPTGGRGFVSQRDTEGRSNFGNEIASPPFVIAGIGAVAGPPFMSRGFSGHRTQTKRCQSPTGCWLRSGPGMPVSQRNPVVPGGASVLVLHQQGPWSHVRYSQGNRSQDGWLPTAMLA